MSLHWRGPDHPIALLPECLPNSTVREVMEETANRIAAIPEAEITRLVGRVPHLYLPEPYSTNIIQNLVARRGNLLATLGV